MKGKKIALGVLRSYGDQDSLSTFTEPRSPPEDIILTLTLVKTYL